MSIDFSRFWTGEIRKPDFLRELSCLKRRLTVGSFLRSEKLKTRCSFLYVCNKICLTYVSIESRTLREVSEPAGVASRLVIDITISNSHLLSHGTILVSTRVFGRFFPSENREGNQVGPQIVIWARSPKGFTLSLLTRPQHRCIQLCSLVSGSSWAIICGLSTCIFLAREY